MDKDLLDISGGDDEDYWLLNNTPKKVNSSREKSYLNCSPLQIPRSSRIVPTRPPFSPIGRVTGNNNSMEQPCPTVDTDSVGKENSKVELPKLSVERQQMKKKKKNAGFNLRKSLAWDRAFSTEEGVLDSSELSKITGTACQIGRDRLSAIQEEYRESTSASKCTSVSPGLQALEENLFDDLPVNSKHREKKFVSGILPKYGSPSKAQSSLAPKKVTSAQELRSGSKRSGCPRPPPSSSLKRPANVHTTTSRSRELSISKVPTTKSDPISAPNNMKRTTQSPSKPKNSQPTQLKNSQISLGSGSSSRNTSSIKNKTKSSLASKPSIPKPSLKPARRNLISKTSEISSVSNSQHSVVGKSNLGPVTTSTVAMLGHGSTDSNVITMGTSLAQSSCNRVGNTQSAVSRLGKPSGLRVPKPSIGYFSQSDSQPSHGAGDKNSQLARSDVCSASHFSSIPTFKKPQIAEKVPRVNSKAATGNFSSSGSTAKFSAQSILPKPSQEKVKVDLKSTQEVESKALCCSLSSQINENLQHQCTVQGDTGKLAMDDVTYCTSEKISTAKSEEFQSNSAMPHSGCKSNVHDGNMSDDNRDERRKSCCSDKEYCASPLKDSMESPMQGPPCDELTLFDNYSQLKVSNREEEDMCSTNDFSRHFDTPDVHGQPLNGCVHPGIEEEISPCLSGEKDALIVYQSTEDVAKQPEVLDSFTADPTFNGDFGSIKGDVDSPFSSENRLGNTENVFIPFRPAEAPDCVQSPCNQLEENAVSNILCDHNMVCNGQAVLETEERTEISDCTETNCDADFIGPFSACKDWFRESEEQHLSSQLVFEMKEGGHEIDVLTRDERADESDMQIESFTGSSDADNMEQVKLLMPSSVEVSTEIKPFPEKEIKPFPEKSTSEKQKQYNSSSSEITSDVNDGCVTKQADQLGTLVGCSPEKDESAAVFSYSNEELEDNLELEDMDLVTDSDCSDEEPEDNLERTEVDVITGSELTGDIDEFSVKGILKQEYPEVEDIHTASDLCGKTNTLLSESISSSDSIFGNPEYLNESTVFSRIPVGMSKDDSNSGGLEHNYVVKAKFQIDAEKDFSAQVSGQEIVPHEGEEVQIVKISPDPVALAPRVEESGTPVAMKETFSVRDDMQTNESNVFSDDILTLESKTSEGNDKRIPLDAKLEKKPDPIIVKPPNAVPFSDEWLAAIEAAGEEILTLKSGRVQHSPTEKSVPEPGPWSPVKKKSNQVVGPFDCTKYNNKGLPPAFD
ncbi:PREDICTED: uncharacterized protein LOC104726612 [Camelina sativa]|uniref:Uncharacterized protein LOC104726612 n=1 Tax=Camelina sativa TaxID=90675 RepID=A0ABM0UNM6_CAMSA|nr:PREDICTED: uncharacterized protein LOC104726612 [Camelina sativa]